MSTWASIDRDLVSWLVVRKPGDLLSLSIVNLWIICLPIFKLLECLHVPSHVYFVYINHIGCYRESNGKCKLESFANCKNWSERSEKKALQVSLASQSLTFSHPAPQRQKGRFCLGNPHCKFSPMPFSSSPPAACPTRKKLKSSTNSVFPGHRDRTRQHWQPSFAVCSLRSTGLNALSQPGSKSTASTDILVVFRSPSTACVCIHWLLPLWCCFVTFCYLRPGGLFLFWPWVPHLLPPLTTVSEKLMYTVASYPIRGCDHFTFPTISLVLGQW